MKKIIMLLILIIIILMITAEPYKPYPVIAVHGYNTDNYKASNFGIVMQRSEISSDIDYSIASSPVEIDGEDGLWYISRNEGKRIEYGKLVYQCAEFNRDILDYWQSITENNEDEFYWLKNDEGKYREITSTDEILPKYPDDISVSQPINCFLETIEFDSPGTGSSDEDMPNKINPTNFQVGRARELICKLKETLINYYTEGVIEYQKHPIYQSRFYDVLIKLPGENARVLKESDLKGDSKVIFVAHSYGGVNVRNMLLELDKNAGDKFLINHIEKIVLVNSPMLGTPAANQYIKCIQDTPGIPSWILDASWWFLFWRTQWILGTQFISYIPNVGDYLEYTIAPTLFKTVFKLDTDAAYDCQEYGSPDIDGKPHLTNIMTEPDNLAIQSQVKYNIFSSTLANNINIRSLCLNIWYSNAALRYGEILVLLSSGNIPRAALVTIKLVAEYNSFFEWMGWLNTSDIVIPLKSQNAIEEFNDTLRENEHDERFSLEKKAIYKNNYAHSSVEFGPLKIKPGAYNYDKLYSLIEKPLEINFLSMNYDGNEEILTTENELYDEELKAYVISGNPLDITGEIDKYFLAKGGNTLKINRKLIGFGFGETETEEKDLNIRFGIDNGNQFTIKGDFKKYFYRGKNVIKIYSNNVLYEDAEKSIILYIADGPKINTSNIRDYAIINEINDSIEVIKHIIFEENATKFSLDSMIDYIYKLPVSTLIMQDTIIKRENITHNNEENCNDTLYLHDVEEGRYEIFSLGHYIEETAPVAELAVFYVDTTAPTVIIVNYTLSKKYSIRNQGFLRFQYIPEDNFKYFFPFYEKGIVRIYDNNDIKDACVLDMGTFGGVNYASFYYDSADIANFPDGDYYAEIIITDKAGLDGVDTVEFIVDNTPPEITIVESFEDSIFNMYDVSKDIVINVNEKCEVSVLFENVNGLSISNDAYCDTLQFEFNYNETTNKLDSIPTKDIKIFAGCFGANVYLPDGRYHVNMIGTDEVKNDTTILLYNEFIVDRTPPVIINPVCMPFVVNSDNQVTLHFNLSEINDSLINTGDISYIITLNGNGIYRGIKLKEDIEPISIELDVDDNIPNGINNIKIIVTDKHLNKSYGYAQFINKTIGTYISQPNEDDTIYLGIANIIEGIANDPDMTNMKPFEKYALYWVDGSITVIPTLRSELELLNTNGMITPISNRNGTVSENESVVFCEYIEKLGVYLPEQLGEQTILLASFEEGSDIISCDMKSVEVVDGSGIAIPEITYMNIGKAIDSSDDFFNVEEDDSMYIKRQFKNKVSDVIIDIINENGINVYKNTSKNIVPLWGKPIFNQVNQLEGVFIWTVNDSFFIEINTPEDENMKSIVVTSLNGHEIFADTTDTMISIANNKLLISGKTWNKRIGFKCDDENIEFMVSPEYYNVYTGSGLAEALNSFEYNRVDYKGWNFKDKFGRYISSGDYSVYLTVVGTDGVGVDTEIMDCEIINPLMDTITIIPDTINVLNPMKDYLEVNTTLNQRGYVRYNLEIVSKGNISREITTDTIALNYLFQNTYRYSDFSIDDSILNCEVIVYNADLTDSVISNYTIPFSNTSISVINEGLFIPKEYCTSADTTAEIYDGKGEFLYSFDADGGIYLPREVNYDINVNAQKYANNVSVKTKLHGYGICRKGFIRTISNGIYTFPDFLENFNDVDEILSVDNVYITFAFTSEGFVSASTDVTTFISEGFDILKIRRTDSGSEYYPHHYSVYLFNTENAIHNATPESGYPPLDTARGIFSKNSNGWLRTFITKKGEFIKTISDVAYTDPISVMTDTYSSQMDFLAGRLWYEAAISIFSSNFFANSIYSVQFDMNWNGESFFVDKPYNLIGSIYTGDEKEILFNLEDSDDEPLKYKFAIDTNTVVTETGTYRNDVLHYWIQNSPDNRLIKDTSFIDTVNYNISDGAYETLIYKLYDKTDIPPRVDSFMTYDTLYSAATFNNIVGDEIDIHYFGIDESGNSIYKMILNDTFIALGQEYRITGIAPYNWTTETLPEANQYGKIISNNLIPFLNTDQFPADGESKHFLKPWYPITNNEQSMIITDESNNLVSNPLVRLDDIEIEILYPDLSANSDLIIVDTYPITNIGEAGLTNFDVKNLLRAKPKSFLPIKGNLLPDTINKRFDFYYNINVKVPDSSYNIFSNRKVIPDSGEVIGYLNTMNIFGNVQINVPIYHRTGGTANIDGIGDVINDSLICIYTKDIFIGDEIENGLINSTFAQTTTPYKRGVLSFMIQEGAADTVKLNFHIAPEMIVDNGEEPFIGESFCPIININSMKSTIGRPVINYYLTAEEMNEYEESYLKFYGIDNNGEIVQFPTTYDVIKDINYNTLGYKFYIEGTIYDFDNIEYITLLDNTVTDESKFDEIYTSEITDNGIIFTLESEDMINRINEKGIGIIITDPIENVYDALMLLNEQQQMIDNGNNLFDVIGNADDNKLLSDDPCTLVRFFGIDSINSVHIVELTDDFVKILIPNDSLYVGYNHLFFGNYDALYRGIGLTDTNFMNLGIDIDNGSTYKFKNSAIKEISFNYIVPKILEMDTLVIIDDYIGKFINIVLSDSTSAVIFIKDMLGNQVYTTSLSYQSIENGFHWNGLLNPGQSDNGKYRYEVIPFSVNGVLGESEQGTIIIDRHPDVEIILPEENSWYNNNLLLVAENHTYPIGTINWYMDMGFGNISLGSSFNNDTISFNTNTTINGDNFRIFAESSDRYTNIGIDTVLIRIDNTEPEIVLQSNQNVYVNDNEVYYQYPISQVEFLFTDTYSYLDYLKYIIDGDTTMINLYSYPSYILSFDVYELNNKTIELTATDNCGNESGIVEYSFIQDNEIPTVELVIGEPQLKSDGKLYISDYTPIWIIADDTLSGIKDVLYTVDTLNVTTIWTEYTGSQFYLDYTESNADTLYFRAEDNVGNSIIDSQIFYFDCTPPVSTIEYSEPSYISGEDIYLTEISTIKISSTDDMSGIKELEYTIDGTSYIDSNSTVNIGLMGLPDGLHIITYFATDNAGNIEETQEFIFHIDNTPPTINITFTIPHYENDYQFVTSDALIDVIAIDNGCGVNKVNYDIDGLLEGSFTDSVSVSLNTLLENEYLLNIFGYDNLNNTVQTDSQFVIDNSTPITEMTINEPKYLKADTILITSATDIELISNDMPINTPSSGVKAIYYGYDNINIMNGNTVTDNIMGIDSIYSYNYYGVDNLNNTETNKSVLFELDNTAPEAIITYPYDGIFINQPVNVKAYIYDKNFKNWKLEYREVNNVNWTVLTNWQTQIPADSILGIFDGSSVQDGYYIIKLTAEDFVYNTTIDEINIKVGEPVQDLELTGYMKPKGVWADEYIYIADTHNKRIAKVNTDNELLLEIKEFQPTDVFVDNRGRIFATDHKSKVYIYSASGDELKSIDGFLHPKGIEVKNDLIYIADTYRNRIVIYSISGTLIQEISGMKHPEGIAIDENGNIFTCIDESNEIRGYNSAGTEIFRYGVVGHDPGEFVRAIDVDIDSKGFLWVCDRNNNRVHMIDWKNKTDLLMIGDRGLHNHFEDEMNKPSGLSIVEENGNVKYLYIADTNNDRIVRYNLDIVDEDKKVQIASLAGNELTIEQFLPYPNPTSDESNVRVVLNKPADIVINIFTITGKLVYASNIAGAAGINEVIWTGNNTAGATVLNGVYNIQVIATNGNESVERWSKIAIIR